jgi:hypothetical protein
MPELPRHTHEEAEEGRRMMSRMDSSNQSTRQLRHHMGDTRLRG